MLALTFRRHHRRRALCALLALGIGAASLHAQSGDASVTGAVRDSVGMALANVAIDAVHGPTGYHVRTVTNVSGSYFLPALPLGGPITITARRIGFASAVQAGLRLAIGAHPEVNFTLRLSAVAITPVAVRADGTEGREHRIGGSTRIDRQAIASLPVTDRNFSSLATLSPMSGTQLSLGGMRWTSTDIRIDGLQSRNMLRAGEANGGPAAIPLDAVREFEVNTATFDVGQGREGGGQIAAATRFGTNVSEGGIFTSYRSQELSASSDYQGRSRDARTARVQQTGFSVGGPILRDVAHFFAAYERQDSDEPLFNGDVSTSEAQLAAGINKDSLARTIDILGRLYGTSSNTNQLGRLDRRPLSQSALGRLDWQLTGGDHLTLRGTASSWNSPLSGGVDQTIALREARSGFDSRENQIAATLASALGGATRHESQFAFGSSQRDLTPVTPGVPRGFVQVRSVLPDGTTGNATIQFGGNRLAPDASREWTLQFRDRVTTDRGKFIVSAGTDNSLTSATTLIAESQSGLFVFPSIAALEAKQPNRFTRTVPIAGASPETQQRILELGAFAQAEWRVSPNLTVTTGLRWDGTAFLTAPARQLAVDTAFGVHTDRAPTDWRQWQPRAEAVWRVGGEGKHVVRIGAGRFTAQVPYYAQHNQLLYTGTSLTDIDLRGAAVPTPNFTAYRDDPSTVPGITGARGVPYVNVVGNFRAPVIDKALIAWEGRVSRQLTMTLGAQFVRSTHQYQYVDRNLRDAAAFRLDNEANRPVFVPASTIPAATGATDVRNAVANPAFARVVALESNARATGVSFTAEASYRPAQRFRADVGYAWSRARDNSTYGCCLARTATTFTPVAADPRDLSASWAPSDLDARHRIVGTGVFTAPWGIELAVRYRGQSGRPFSLVVDGDINGDEANGNDLAFLFDPDNANTDPAVAASMRKLLANPSNIAAGYIRSHLGSIASRNALYTPWTHRVDMRMLKNIRVSGRTNIAVTVDLFNVGNLLHKAWGAQYLLPAGISSQNPVVNRIGLLRVTGFDQATKRFRYSVNESAGALSKTGDPYQAQLGIRVGW